METMKEAFASESSNSSSSFVDRQHAAEAVEHGDLWTAASLETSELELIYSHLDDRPFEEWLKILREAVEEYKDDPLISPKKIDMLCKLSLGPLAGQDERTWQDLVAFEALVIYDWSIYPEVRNVTRPIDEPGDDYHNLRVYVIACIWTLAGGTVDTFFAPRTPSIAISDTALQILIAASGHLWALLPRCSIRCGSREIVVNNGRPWSFKEQTLATLGMTVAANNPYSQQLIITQANEHFYGMSDAKGFGYQITLTLASALMGFGFAGIFRTLLVYPPKMIWFSQLSLLKISRVFSEKDIRQNVSGWKLKRGEFVLIFGLISFCWYWIVTNLLSFLSVFNWMGYIAPENVNLNAMTGLNYGLGINPIPTFDFSFINDLSGIFTPVYGYANYIAGMFIGMFAVIIIWYTNVRHTAYFPIASQTLYDNTANFYNVSKVLDEKTLAFDEEKYQQYSLPYWSAYSLLQYATFFMVYPVSVVYSLLNYHRELLAGYKITVQALKSWSRHTRPIDNFNDSFCRRQQRYKEVPEYVYLLVLVAFFGMAVGCIEGYGFTDTPVWTIVFGIALALVFLPVSSILLAQTTFSFETNVLFELVIGAALESNNQALLVSKCFATNFFGQAQTWIANQKVAHYAGISPWSMFSIQFITTCLVSFVQIGIITFQLNGGIDNMCDPENKQRYICQGPRTYFNSSVMWGLIGPRRIFKAVYPHMKWVFLIGAFVPVPTFAWRRLGPKLAQRRNLSRRTWRGYIVSGAFLEYVNEVLICTAAALHPSFSSVGQSILPDYYVHLLFQLYIRPKFPHWWRKYAYLISPSLNMGTSWAAFFNFWATQYRHIVYLNAWTNNVQTMDNTLTAVQKVLPSGEYFGPRRGTFP